MQEISFLRQVQKQGEWWLSFPAVAAGVMSQLDRWKEQLLRNLMSSFMKPSQDDSVKMATAFIKNKILRADIQLSLWLKIVYLFERKAEAVRNWRKTISYRWVSLYYKDLVHFVGFTQR